MIIQQQIFDIIKIVKTILMDRNVYISILLPALVVFCEITIDIINRSNELRNFKNKDMIESEELRRLIFKLSSGDNFGINIFSLCVIVNTLNIINIYLTGPDKLNLLMYSSILLLFGFFGYILCCYLKNWLITNEYNAKELYLDKALVSLGINIENLIKIPSFSEIKQNSEISLKIKKGGEVKIYKTHIDSHDLIGKLIPDSITVNKLLLYKKLKKITSPKSNFARFLLLLFSSLTFGFSCAIFLSDLSF